MESRIAGKLKPDEYTPEMYQSAPLKIPYFENKKLGVAYFELSDPTNLIDSDRVLENFLNQSLEGKNKDAELVHTYYSEILNFGYIQPLDIKETNDIWQFVHPSHILIDSDEDGFFNVYISCECDWEVEHGLELIFKNGTDLIRANAHE